MKPTGTSVAAYIRVSSDKQDTQRQEQSISDWAARNGLSVGHWFRDAEGRNPRDQAHKRREFQRLLRAVEARQVDTIVVDSQDRFGTKDAYEFGKYVSLLRDHGAELWDSSGKHLSGDDELAVLSGTLGAITSQKEQKEKAHRNVGGKVAKAKAGEYQGGYPPYGLDVVCFGPDGAEKWRTTYLGHFKRLKVYPDGKQERFDGKDNTPAKDAHDTLRFRPSRDSKRLNLVRQVFEWYTSEAISPGKIAARLNQIGVDAIIGKNGKASWNKVKVTSLLRNPAYIGLPAWNKRGASRFKEWRNGQIQDVQ